MGSFYENEPFVRVLPAQYIPCRRKAVLGSNYCDVGLEVDTRTRRVVAMAAIDNLGKGAAGAVVQNLNLMFGFDETDGLKVADEFWDFLGGDGVYQDLLDCFEKVGIELRPEIERYFEKFRN